MNDNSIIVSVCMITYNHEAFIRQAIEGVLVQKTGFKIELVIGEDFSTDGTRAICEEYALRYPGLLKLLPSEKNLGMNNNFLRTLAACRGKYVALCEGDDYWIDPFKLEKQVGFLESNSDYVLCVSGFKSLNIYTHQEIDTIKIPFGVSKKDNGYSFSLHDMEKDWITKTLTAVFRNNRILVKELVKYKYCRDVNLFYHILKNNQKSFYFTEIFGVYRIHEGGVNSMKQGWINITAAYNVYKELYHINRDTFTRCMYFQRTLHLLNFYLYNKNSFNLFLKIIKLIFEALFLIRNLKNLELLRFYLFNRLS